MSKISRGDFVFVAGEGDEVFKVTYISEHVKNQYAVVANGPERCGFKEPIKKLTKINSRVKTVTISRYMIDE